MLWTRFDFITTTILVYLSIPLLVQGHAETIVTVDGEGLPCPNNGAEGIHGCANNNDNWQDGRRHEIPIAVVCQDLRPYCAERAETCQTHWKFMHAHCPQTCHVCHNLTRTVAVTARTEPVTEKMEDDDLYPLKGRRHHHQQDAAPMGIRGDEIILNVAGADMGVAQLLDPMGTGEYRREIIRAIRDAREYMQDVVMVEKRYEKVRDVCRNEIAHCAFFAVRLFVMWYGDCSCIRGSGQDKSQICIVSTLLT